MVDFKCGVHLDENGKEYSIPDFEQWKLHIANFDHEHTGFVDCKDCGKPNIPQKVTMKKQHNIVAPAYCEDCINRLKETLIKNEVIKI